MGGRLQRPWRTIQAWPRPRARVQRHLLPRVFLHHVWSFYWNRSLVHRSLQRLRHGPDRNQRNTWASRPDWDNQGPIRWHSNWDGFFLDRSVDWVCLAHQGLPQMHGLWSDRFLHTLNSGCGCCRLRYSILGHWRSLCWSGSDLLPDPILLFARPSRDKRRSGQVCSNLPQRQASDLPCERSNDYHDCAVLNLLDLQLYQYGEPECLDSQLKHHLVSLHRHTVGAVHVLYLLLLLQHSWSPPQSPNGTTATSATSKTPCWAPPSNGTSSPPSGRSPSRPSSSPLSK